MDEESDNIDNIMDGQYLQPQGTKSNSPAQEKRAMPKSPVKRMRQLEDE